MLRKHDGYGHFLKIWTGTGAGTDEFQDIWCGYGTDTDCFLKVGCGYGMSDGMCTGFCV